MVRLVQRIRATAQRHGLANTLYAHALKAVEALFALKILRGVHVARPDPSFLKCAQPYTPGFLSPGDLREQADNPETELSGRFLDEALARGDQCYAIRENEILAAYGWYSFGRTPIGLPNLVLNFSADYVYMYKGFTDSRHRGQRLHAIGMTRALEHYLAEGYKGLVSYVEASNLDSLKSCFRMGYRVFGSIYILRVFGRYYAVSSPGCMRFAFRLDRPASRPALSAARRTAPAR